MLSVFDLLVMHPATADLPAGWLHRLAPFGRPTYQCAGYRLFPADGPADQFWLVHSGIVAVDLPVPGRGNVVVEELGAGSVVGWSWLLPPYRWHFGALVMDNIRAVEFDAASVRAVIAEDPQFGMELETRFLAVLAERLAASQHWLIQLSAAASCPRDRQ